jgi:aminoglycoside 2''-phosphotransferase
MSELMVPPVQEVECNGFLAQLHATPTEGLDWDLPATPAPVTRGAWADIRRRFRESVDPLLLPHQRQWVEELFQVALDNPHFFDYEPALIHGDLAPYHILFAPDEGSLCGILDFGVAGMGDPATDIGSLLTSYGETWASHMGGVYPRLAAYLPRARFYAKAIELQWVLLGIETGETFWFTAHLGGARDTG